jgi:hypothetical protein
MEPEIAQVTPKRVEINIYLSINFLTVFEKAYIKFSFITVRILLSESREDSILAW